MASGGEDHEVVRRRSQRTRNPPIWHGDYEVGDPVASSTPRNQPGPSRRPAEDEVSVASHRSSATVRSIASLKRVDLHMDLGRKILDFEKERDKVELSIRTANTSLLQKRLQIHKLQKSLSIEPIKDSEFEEEIRSKLDLLKIEVEKDSMDIAAKEIKFKALEREITFTQKEINLREAQISEEGFDDILKTSITSPEEDKTKSTKSWVASNQAMEDSSDEDSVVTKEKIREMLKTQHRKKKVEKYSQPIEQRIKHEKSKSIPNESVALTEQSVHQVATSPIEQIAQGLVQALSKITGGETAQKDQRKFMARHSHIKDLPQFNGKPEEWLQFEGAFKRTTLSCGYSDEENLDRLRRALKGEAAKAVISLMATPKNVPEILKKLEIRFGDPSRIIRALIENAKAVAPVKEEKLETVLEFGDAVENLTTTIKSLNREDHMSNPQLLEELELKMPASYRVQWREWVVGDSTRNINLSNFSVWIKNKSDIVSRMVKYRAMDKDEKFKKEKQDSPGYRVRNSKTVMTTTEGSAREKEKSDDTCVRCKRRNHTLPTCRTFAKDSEDDRWTLVKENKFCFRCLRPGHWNSKCLSKAVCGKDGCTLSHHSTLHKSDKSRSNSAVKHNSNSEEPSSVSISSNRLEQVDSKFLAHTSSTKFNNSKTTLLRIVPVILEGPRGKKSTFALLDGCAEISLIDTDVADELGLLGTMNPLCIQWTQKLMKTEEDSRAVNLKITGEFPFARTYKLVGTRTLKNLSLPSQNVNLEELTSKWPHLRGSKVKDVGTARPTILIGQDNWQLLETREIRSGPPHAPGLSKTHLGWVIHGGAAEVKRTSPNFMFHICREEEDKLLHRMVQDSFKLESYGGNPVQNRPRSREDKRAIELLERTSTHREDFWTTGLLWKYPDVRLPESRRQALFRLNCMEKKFNKNPSFMMDYKAKMDEYLKKGFVRKLTSEEAAQTGPRTWYLPHFMVYNINKPGKPRLVFDAAAKSRGVSLNDVLSKGPDYLSSLLGCLFKFRQRKYAFTADISDMFHMIRIREEDVQSQRFLWRDGDGSQEPDTFVILRMFFGAASSPCTSQFIKNKNAEEYRKEYPDAYNAIVHKHYMDDYSDSTDTVEEGVKLCRDVIEVHRRGGFKICKFASNSRELLNEIPEDLRSTEVKELTSDKDLPTGRTLGLWWNPEKDVITWKINFSKIKPELLEGCVPTKREVLKLVMSLFDPLGFLSQFVIRARILYQDIWRSEIGWDDEIPWQINEKWQVWIRELKTISNMEIPRCYSTSFSTANARQLHVFCDASTEAYSVVCYFRIESGTGVDIVFVAAKSKVCPLSAVAVPRLELQAALIGSRLAKTIHEEHEIPIETTFYWTDSMTVLKWIRADSRRFKPFVAHRVSEIEELTDISQWRWIPTKENVADDATRSVTPTDLSSSSRWLQGPAFLNLSEKDWPRELEREIETEFEDSEIRPMYVNLLMEIETDTLPDVQRFKFSQLIRITATMKRFYFNCRHPSSKDVSPLRPAELYEAEKIWWKKVQWDSFKSEVHLLSNSEKVHSVSKLKLLSPFMDSDNVIRVQGRTQVSPHLKELNKFPVILDPKHPFTQRLIQHYHEKVANHHGREMVLNEIRQKYWILNARAAVKRAWSKCQLCKNRRAQSQVPEMGQLPASRVTGNVHPFTSTGMDYFGPIEVAIGRRREKRYGVLFTCMATRAIHLEIAGSLTTDSAIMAIRRFAARRGNPKEMFSDNGTNLRGADKELREALKEFDQVEMWSKMTTMGISWNFNPPSAPHTGGSWERMVRSVKSALKETMKERVPREEVLQTLFAEAEAIVNSRPLTYVSDDPEEAEAITPNHFLIGRSSGNQSPGVFTDTDLCLRKQWRISQRLTDVFWRQWTKSYLPTLLRRPKWDEAMKPVQEGNVVRVMMDNTPRNAWPLGRITKVFPGADGKVRVVDVKTQDATYRRPVAKVCVLDLEAIR